MIAYLKRLTIRNIVSPYGLAMLSSFVFLFAWLFPPGLYTEYIHEPDLMFLDPETLLFFTLCVAAFLFGVRSSRFFGASLSGRPEPMVSARNPLFYLLAPLLVATLYCLMCLIVVGGQINFVALLSDQQGNVIKLANVAGQLDKGRWGRAIPVLTGVLWWSLFRARQLQLEGTAKTLFYLLFLLGMGIGILTCVATVDRTNLMPIILGLLVVYLFHKARARSANVAKLAFTGLLSAVGVVGAFLSLSFLRGIVLRLLMTSLLGYTIVSYNRMAALLAGVMHYAYEGRGVYLSSYLLEGEQADKVFQFAARFGWPDALGLWQTEFSSTMAAGLNPGYIWSGTFGYIYSDIGWWTPLYLCLVGVMAGYLWSQFSAGHTVGLVLYPSIGFWILLWFGTNHSLFSPHTIRLSELAIFLYIYDRLFLRRERDIQDVAATTDPAGSLIEPVTNGFAEGLV